MQSKLRNVPGRRTHPLIWCAAIICTVVSIAVIITGIVVFVGYMIIHPRVPFISATAARLDRIDFQPSGLLEVKIGVVIRAENDNKKAHASFSDTSLTLSLDGLRIAQLVAGPFDVKKNSSTDFDYEVESSPIPLDREMMEVVDYSLKTDKITFDLKGSSRARWRVGPLGSVKFLCHLNCKLHFHPSNGTYTSSYCSSKSK